jgi:hypothetical protein
MAAEYGEDQPAWASSREGQELIQGISSPINWAWTPDWLDQERNQVAFHLRPMSHVAPLIG